jgi:hypothetical protein
MDGRIQAGAAGCGREAGQRRQAGGMREGRGGAKARGMRRGRGMRELELARDGEGRKRRKGAWLVGPSLRKQKAESSEQRA